MAVASGTRFGPYEVISPLGAGGMGEVYRARDPRLERVIALKLLPAHVFADEMARTRLIREARAAAALNHPNICTVHEDRRGRGPSVCCNGTRRRRVARRTAGALADGTCAR